MRRPNLELRDLGCGSSGVAVTVDERAGDHTVGTRRSEHRSGVFADPAVDNDRRPDVGQLACGDQCGDAIGGRRIEIAALHTDRRAKQQNT